MLGLKRLPKWLAHAYKKAVDFNCEHCEETKKEEELEIHRIIQGYKNGRYKPSNCKVLCSKCHLKFAEDW